MNDIWDTRADSVTKGDKRREVSPLAEKTFISENGFTHYFFNKLMFKNLWYSIPDGEFELFKDFVSGGSRSYPSDGSIPCDIVAGEARILLNKIVELSNDTGSHHYSEAREVLRNGKIALVRGTIKLYLGKYTTRDWRRKRFTDDIDFWVRKIHVLHHVLRRSGWIKNKNTREWEKNIEWVNPLTGERREHILIAANDLDQLLDFGAGSYLEGGSLKQIFQKKIKRGHEVDLSDLINVVMVNGMDEKIQEKDAREKEWKDAWEAFEAAANMRNTRTTSNLISMCRYSLAIADHIEKVSQSIIKYNDLIFDKSVFPDDQLKRICQTSIHWLAFFNINGPNATRKMLHDFYHEQAEIKPYHATNLRDFARNLLKLLNSKYKHLKIVFKIEK
ncbi:MAG: hypothetical protein ACFFDO_10015 [Candidatus Thorarchaeota archaeon]